MEKLNPWPQARHHRQDQDQPEQAPSELTRGVVQLMELIASSKTNTKVLDALAPIKITAGAAGITDAAARLCGCTDGDRGPPPPYRRPCFGLPSGRMA